LGPGLSFRKVMQPVRKQLDSAPHPFAKTRYADNAVHIPLRNCLFPLLGQRKIALEDILEPRERWAQRQLGLVAAHTCPAFPEPGSCHVDCCPSSNDSHTNGLWSALSFSRLVGAKQEKPAPLVDMCLAGAEDQFWFLDVPTLQLQNSLTSLPHRILKLSRHQLEHLIYVLHVVSYARPDGCVDWGGGDFD
jgi:hypothetical protein